MPTAEPGQAPCAPAPHRGAGALPNLSVTY